ncbi:DUF7513 family protein [Halobacterium wangiae]|uniref:DUF7513 family protein n=1 Tax=Halobacterium wangiae TaxID=2902623 RepID=UPI001E514646|nr:hypothetical protein [Halobacterium wangiae]
MSRFKKFTEGLTFRTNRPSFDVGEELSVFVTGDKDGTPVARIGDTVLHLPDESVSLVDKRVLLRVTEFDENRHVGEAEYLETVGESAF